MKQAKKVGAISLTVACVLTVFFSQERGYFGVAPSLHERGVNEIGTGAKFSSSPTSTQTVLNNDSGIATMASSRYDEPSPLENEAPAWARTLFDNGYVTGALDYSKRVLVESFNRDWIEALPTLIDSFEAQGQSDGLNDFSVELVRYLALANTEDSDRKMDNFVVELFSQLFEKERPINEIQALVTRLEAEEMPPRVREIAQSFARRLANAPSTSPSDSNPPFFET